MNKELQRFEVLNTSLLFEAIEVINKNDKHYALIVDQDRRLLSTMTDGDIRRGILRGYSASSIIEDVHTATCLYVKNGYTSNEVDSIFKQHRINYLPVLDDNHRVIDVLTSPDSYSFRDISNNVVIMAGGMGRRLLPYTENTPKPMLRVGGKPILETLIDQLIYFGFKNIYISVNYLKEQIVDYFGDGNTKGINIKYLTEAKPLGTAGSLSLLPRDLDQPFIVMNGDVLTHLNPLKLIDFHNKMKSHATMCVREHQLTVPYGVIETQGSRIVDIREKPEQTFLINAGMYVLDPVILDLIPHGSYFDMTSLFTLLANSQFSVNACPIYEYWLDIGLPETLSNAHKNWKSNI